VSLHYFDYKNFPVVQELQSEIDGPLPILIIYLNIYNYLYYYYKFNMMYHTNLKNVINYKNLTYIKYN
jgi:hypothetical protein